MIGPLDKIKSRPSAYRRKVALTISISITVIIFLFWLAYLTNGGYASRVTNQKIGPIESFKNALLDFSNTISSTTNDLQNGLANFASTTQNFATSSEQGVLPFNQNQVSD